MDARPPRTGPYAPARRRVRGHTTAPRTDDGRVAR